MPRLFQRVFIALASFVLTAGASAAPFVAPDTQSFPLRRDLLPIDTDSMARLSKDLVILTHGLPLETPAARRAAAQSLALALALDPANSTARDTISELSEGEKLEPANPGRLTQAVSRIWRIHAWLNMPEAGAEGKLLGDMLGICRSHP